jgi:cytochrome c oxidase assembly factor CtaG
MKIGTTAVALLFVGLWPDVAEAHAATAEDSWNVAITCGLAISLTLYGVGLIRLWRRAGWVQGVKAWQASFFLLGWMALALALVSPLERLSDSLFAAHMVEHELLMVVAAPLLAVARPLGAMLWALPIAWRRGFGGLPRTRPLAWAWATALQPGIAWTIHAAVLWFWHAPRLFQAALSNPAIHALQHFCFLGGALLYWWSLLRPAARTHRGMSVLSLFGTTVHSSLLGALIALSPIVWYSSYGHDTGDLERFGLTALEDQQLAGLIMWVPGGLVYLAGALGLLYKNLSAGGTHSLPETAHAERG